MTSSNTMSATVRGALKSFAYSGLRRDRWQAPDRVLTTLSVQPGERVADVGAGGGYFTFLLARAVGAAGAVYAVDTDDDMRHWVQGRAEHRGADNVVVLAPGAGEVGLPEQVGLILLVDAFHHLPQDRVAYFAALAGSLRAEGRLAILEATPRWSRFGHATAPERIRSTLAAAGYALAGEYDFLPGQSFTVFEPPQRAQERPPDA